MHQRLQVTSKNLDEEFASVGLPYSPGELAGLAQADAHSLVAIAGLGAKADERRDRMLMESMEPGSTAYDDIDGPFVTKSLMGRILELPFGAMKAEDFDELIGELEQKKVPEGHQELGEQAVELVSILRELSESATDALDSPMVTKALMLRIADLPLDRLSEEDLDELIEAFGDKDVPEGEDELAEQAGELLSLLQERRVTRRIQGGKRTALKRTMSKEKLRGKRYRRKPTSKKTARKREKRRAAGKFSQAERKNVRKMGGTLGDRKSSARRSVFGESEDMAQDTLATELQGLLDEESATGAFASVTSRIGRIFGLIDEMADDEEVSEVLGEAWEGFDGALTEDMDEAAYFEVVTPCLKLIKRCVESIDSGELGEPHDDDEGDGDPKNDEGLASRAG